MLVYIKTLSGKSIVLDVNEKDHITVIKQKIFSSEHVPISSQRILLGDGKELDDYKTVGDYPTIQNESILHLVLRKSEAHMNRLTNMEQREMRVAHSGRVNQYYNHAAGLNDELAQYTDSETKFDTHQNPQGVEYDLGKDGEFSEFVIVIGRFYVHASNEVPMNLHDAIVALKKKGFIIIETHDVPTFLINLKKADIALIISAGNCSEGAAFAQAVDDFHKGGGALYIWGDNEPYYAHANLLLPLVLKDEKVQLIGNTPGTKILKLGEPTSTGCFGPHIITTGVVRLYEGFTICYPNHLGPLKVLATSTDGFPVSCYADNEALKDDKCGRIVVDCGFTKLYVSWDDAGTARYIVNTCIWLLGLEHKILIGAPIEGKNKHKEHVDEFKLESKAPQGYTPLPAYLAQPGTKRGHHHLETFYNLEPS